MHAPTAASVQQLRGSASVALDVAVVVGIVIIIVSPAGGVLG